MLRVLGSPKRLCNGLTRRDMLHAGGLSLLGLTLADYLHLSEVQATPKKFINNRLVKTEPRNEPIVLKCSTLPPSAPTDPRTTPTVG